MNFSIKIASINFDADACGGTAIIKCFKIITLDNSVQSSL